MLRKLIRVIAFILVYGGMLSALFVAISKPPHHIGLVALCVGAASVGSFAVAWTETTSHNRIAFLMLGALVLISALFIAAIHFGLM